MRPGFFETIDSSGSAFQSTHPSWGATVRIGHADVNTGISIHAPIVGCDHPHYKNRSVSDPFQSTHPSWGATILYSYRCSFLIYFNPRTHRGVRLFLCHRIYRVIDISIHAPIVGCDWDTNAFTNSGSISIHAPIVGCDEKKRWYASCKLRYFNPRTHRGVRHLDLPRYKQQEIFQSTHPSWGATERWCIS